MNRQRLNDSDHNPSTNHYPVSTRVSPELLMTDLDPRGSRNRHAQHRRTPENIAPPFIPSKMTSLIDASTIRSLAPGYHLASSSGRGRVKHAT